MFFSCPVPLDIYFKNRVFTHNGHSLSRYLLWINPFRGIDLPWKMTSALVICTTWIYRYYVTWLHITYCNYLQKSYQQLLKTMLITLVGCYRDKHETCLIRLAFFPGYGYIDNLKPSRRHYLNTVIRTCKKSGKKQLKIWEKFFLNGIFQHG